MAPAELRVDTGVLANEGNGLLRAAEEIPAAPEPFTAVGADPLSTALSARVQAAVAPLISVPDHRRWPGDADRAADGDRAP